MVHSPLEYIRRCDMSWKLGGAIAFFVGGAVWAGYVLIFM